MEIRVLENQLRETGGHIATTGVAEEALKKAQDDFVRAVNHGNQNNTVHPTVSGTVAEQVAEQSARSAGAGGLIAGTPGHAALYQIGQLERIVQGILDRKGQLFEPRPLAMPPSQAKRVLNYAANQVSPRWDDMLYQANRFGEEMRSFGMVDFWSRNRIDEILGMFAPYAYWTTRTMKNAMERMFLEPMAFSRMYRLDQQLQNSYMDENMPTRFKGYFPVKVGDFVYNFRMLPQKYWPMFPTMVYNEYNKTSDVDNPAVKVFDGLSTNGLSGYFWWEMLANAAKGEPVDWRLLDNSQQTRAISDIVISQMPPEMWKMLKPLFTANTERNIATALTNQFVRNEITQLELAAAQSYMQHIYQGTVDWPLPEYENVSETRLNEILKQAAGRGLLFDAIAAGTSGLTSVTVKPYDTAENKVTRRQQEAVVHVLQPDREHDGRYAGGDYFIRRPEGWPSSLCVELSEGRHESRQGRPDSSVVAERDV